MDSQNLVPELVRLKRSTGSSIIHGDAAPLRSITHELKLYFEGGLKEFKTPLFFLGTPFQKQVWKELTKIPYGKTMTYAGVAEAVGRPSGYRAVAQANGANRLVIVVPCHRVIYAQGGLGGYKSGVLRKKWLLDLEGC